MLVKIVSNQPLYREALAEIVRADLHADVVLQAQDLDSIPQTEASADLLVLDLPTSAEPNVWLPAAARAPGSKRLLALPERNIAMARLAHANGFRGLLPKSSDRALMIAILKLVMAGGEYFPCFDDIAETPARPEPIAPKGLSSRQCEVFSLMHEGRTNKEIAKLLDISIATVKLHVQAILAFAGARNRMEAVRRLVDSQG
jgi:two-component system nitrate/nitrite response regulator NarL